jgi:hypothetical protein
MDPSLDPTYLANLQRFQVEKSIKTLGSTEESVKLLKNKKEEIPSDDEEKKEIVDEDEDEDEEEEEHDPDNFGIEDAVDQEPEDELDTEKALEDDFEGEEFDEDHDITNDFDYDIKAGNKIDKRNKQADDYLDYEASEVSEGLKSLKTNKDMYKNLNKCYIKQSYKDKPLNNIIIMRNNHKDGIHLEMLSQDDVNKIIAGFIELLNSHSKTTDGKSVNLTIYKNSKKNDMILNLVTESNFQHKIIIIGFILLYLKRMPLEMEKLVYVNGPNEVWENIDLTQTVLIHHHTYYKVDEAIMSFLINNYNPFE